VTVPAVTLDEAMAHLNAPGLGDSDQAELQRFVLAASGAAERWKREVLAPRDVVESHDVPASGVVFLRSYPVLTDTDIEVTVDDGDPTVETDVDGRIGRLVALSGAGRRASISFRAGWDPVPEEYRAGVLMIVSHMWRTQRRPLGQQSRFGGGNTDDETQMVGGYAVPRAALELLGPRGVA
jgi:hypothetical protein